MDNGDISEVTRQFEAIMGGGNARGQRTRAEIIERAAQAFGESGFHGTSLRSIARRSGIDHSTLKHHFPTKEELLAAVLMWRDRQGLRDLQALNSGPVIDARMVPQAVAEQARRNGETPVLTQLYSVLSAEAGQEGHPAREYLQQRQEMVISALEKMLFGCGVETRFASANLSARDLAILLVNVWDGMQVCDALNPGMLDVPAMMYTVTDLMLRGIEGGGPELGSAEAEGE